MVGINYMLFYVNCKLSTIQLKSHEQFISKQELSLKELMPRTGFGGVAVLPISFKQDLHVTCCKHITLVA